MLEDEDDFQAHFDYIPNNPVKHRWVKCPGDWEPSRFHRWVRAGVSDSDSACGNGPAPTFPETPDDYGEPGESADE